MPIYEYICDACGHELEALQKINDDPLKDCPGCEQQALRKKISAAAFRLKGGGWYETDFKSGNKKNLAGGEDGKTGGKAEGEKTAKAGKEGDSKAGDSQASKSESKTKKEAASKKDAGTTG